MRSRSAPFAFLLILGVLPGSTTSFAPTRPPSIDSRMTLLAISSAPDEEAVESDTERSLLLDEIEDLARSFETVQRTISINREIYEERVAALTERLEEAQRERDELRNEIDWMQRAPAAEGVKWAKERESLSKARDALKKQVIDAKAESIQEKDRLRLDIKDYERKIEFLETKSEKLEQEIGRLRGAAVGSKGAGSSGNGSVWEDERSALVQEKNNLVDEVVRNKMSFTSEKSRLQADFGSILRERDLEMNELRQKIATYEEERSSLRKLTILGMKRVASLFRFGKKENNSN